MPQSHLALLVSLVVAAVAAGCTEEPSNQERAGGGLPSYVVDLSVRSAHVEQGRCFDGATAFRQECHIVRVHVDNRANDVEVQLRLSWSASDTEGGGASGGDVQGPDHVPPGGEADVTVRYTVAEGSPRLTKVHFSGFPNVRGAADVPAY